MEKISYKRRDYDSVDEKSQGLTEQANALKTIKIIRKLNVIHCINRSIISKAS